MTELYVSLGHNSSAIVCDGARILAGFEQERIDRVKSSSAPPRNAIVYASFERGMADLKRANITHWFETFDMDRIRQSKYWFDLSLVGCEIKSHSDFFTHHDAHAHSARSFWKSHDGGSEPKRVVVCDGFGNMREHFSVYEIDPKDGHAHRLFKSYGYDLSLGLFYQFATESMGMKANQDEYKILGYQSLIQTVMSRRVIEDMRDSVLLAATTHASKILAGGSGPISGDLDPLRLIDLNALKDARAGWDKLFGKWKSWAPVGSERIVVSYCTQLFLETCMRDLLQQFNIYSYDTAFAGGVFYNVRLNGLIARDSTARVAFHPLAGDQGAALGFGVDKVIDRLDIGMRFDDHRLPQALPSGVIMSTEDDWVNVAKDKIREGKIVNVLRGRMEYGPRALCYTTTFAPPTLENVKLINESNARSTVMPMAPVVTRDAAVALFGPRLDNVVGSHEYMVIAVDYEEKPGDDMLGAAHPDPLDGSWSGRPQVATDPQVVGLLESVGTRGALINTSFNYHGEPIVLSASQAIKTHEAQVAAIGSDRIVTIITKD